MGSVSGAFSHMTMTSLPNTFWRYHVILKKVVEVKILQYYLCSTISLCIYILSKCASLKESGAGIPCFRPAETPACQYLTIPIEHIPFLPKQAEFVM
jgi:hypothetical protein